VIYSLLLYSAVLVASDKSSRGRGPKGLKGSSKDCSSIQLVGKYRTVNYVALEQIVDNVEESVEAFYDLEIEEMESCGTYVITGRDVDTEEELFKNVCVRGLSEGGRVENTLDCAASPDGIAKLSSIFSLDDCKAFVIQNMYLRNTLDDGRASRALLVREAPDGGFAHLEKVKELLEDDNGCVGHRDSMLIVGGVNLPSLQFPIAGILN